MMRLAGALKFSRVLLIIIIARGGVMVRSRTTLNVFKCCVRFCSGRSAMVPFSPGTGS